MLRVATEGDRHGRATTQACRYLRRRHETEEAEERQLAHHGPLLRPRRLHPA
ncbi:primase C-terminal domain-containing protein [Nocardia sp. XZ_19_385]|uniref:primase C-terminal domain-containing protein n=1 Tax=Nocardia sp. XZ_19_385 TaxID=2769488 RepID=UPI0035CD2359